MTGALPAIMNAVLGALTRRGVRHLDMPASERIWRALRAADQRQGKPGVGSSDLERRLAPDRPAPIDQAIARLTAGMTFSAMSAIERRASFSSIQSWPA